MQNRHNQPDNIKENIIDSVVLNLQYNEYIHTEKQALDTAESHFYNYMFPTIRDTIETYKSRQIAVEKIEIDLGSVELRDIPQKLEMMLKEALEKHISENEEQPRREREVSAFEKSSNQHMIDFLCQEQLPWTEEPEFFEPETWWNENLPKLLSTPSDLRTLYELCQSEVATLYRLLTYSNRLGLIRILTKWMVDDDLIPHQLKRFLSKACLTTEHTISLKIKELTKPQIELLLITVLSIKEHSNSIILKNVTNVLTGIIQKTFDHAQEISEEYLLKELLNQAYSNVKSNSRHFDKISVADKDVSAGDSEISAAADKEIPTAKTEISFANIDLPVADTDLPVADTEILTVDTELSIADTDISVADKEISITDTKISVADTDISTVNTEISNADAEILATNAEISTTDTDFPTIDKEISIADKEFSTANTDIRNALIQHDYSVRENTVSDNNERTATPQRYGKSLERNREMEGNTQEFSTEGINTDKQFKMLLNCFYSNMQSFSVNNDYDTEDHNKYSTDVAGIVLLHPFLANYFRQVKLVDENNQFISLEKQIHAVHLLSYLTGKRKRHHSHLLNVEKIICGLSPTFPIPTKYHINEMEKKEAQDMFAAIKQYWKSISKTSIEGIQTSFIHRQGIITFEEPYWLIRVEGSTLDILMDDLPWEMSMLIFPWMDRNILIEWQNAN